MHDDASSRKPASATTSQSRQPPDDTAAESEFLQSQATDARAAIDETLRQMRETFKDAGDVEAWARKYPWPSVGLAAAFGFLAATTLTAKRRAADETTPTLLERVLADEEIASRLRELSGSQETVKPPLVKSLFTSFMKVFGGSLESAIIAALTAKTQASTTTNGYTESNPNAADG